MPDVILDGRGTGSTLKVLADGSINANVVGITLSGTFTLNNSVQSSITANPSGTVYGFPVGVESFSFQNLDKSNGVFYYLGSVVSGTAWISGGKVFAGDSVSIPRIVSSGASVTLAGSGGSAEVRFVGLY